MTEQTLQEITAAIVHEVHPDAIILFGSYATGKARSDSDLDLLIIENSPFGSGRDRRKEIVKLARVLARFKTANDILIYSRNEVERWRNARNHVIATALREGKVLYGQP